ncbi:hypothetical protein DMO17_11530 [Aquipseudomonas alcaligenes]|uniref:Uncharacterized protein n=1 Tax=Aquipseudomonas alcaligenes TaxID=43263 RepID=A0A2V4KS57_AQUAC|nr:hypothetical protein [Pseudomonas alcaligenes]PYC24691.1 hypothetical protein DMO17_11530 [Pseudomonas alcaligenes]
MLIWKIVFWVTTTLILFAVLTLPFAYIFPEAEDIVALAIQILGQFCIYGYAYQKAVGTKNIAIAAFLLNLGLSIYSLIDAAPLLLEIKETWGIIVAIAAISIVAVLLIPLYRYSFKSEHIWGSAA